MIDQVVSIYANIFAQFAGRNSALIANNSLIPYRRIIYF